MSEKSLSEPLLSSPLLSVRNLTVSFGSAVVVDDVSFDLDAGETVALVGPSGSGKSTIVSALLGLLPDTARASGSIVLNGRELVDLDPCSWQDVRGAAIGIVPQDPFGWFNPVRRIDKQIAETVGAHAPDLSRKERDAAAIVLLDRVGIVGRRAAHSFPHQLSGGMRQRAAIAGAIAHQPPVLVADEPTSALDPTIQAQVIEVLRLLRDESRTMLLVSHDRGVVRDLADRTLDIRDGRLRDAVPASPVPEAKRRELPAPAQYAIRCSQLTKHFGPVHAVDDVTLAVRPGETMAVIGESGCGKTTLARLLAGLETPAAGSVEIGGEGLAGMSRLTRSRRVQFVFQDAGASLDPRFSVLDTVAEPLRAHGEWTAGGSDRVREAIALVGLSADLLQRRPSELSGGQQQRVALARALVLQPDVVVLDEPVSALDPESRDAVLSVLDQMQRERKVACIVVSHDLDVVRRVADSVAVMYLGRVVEIGSAADVFERPSMPYTLALLSAAGMTGEAMLVLGGEIADAADPPSGCRFRTRCWKATDLCATEQPALIDRGHNHPAACHYPE